MSRSGTIMQAPALDMLLLAKGAGKAIREGLQEKGKHRPAAGDDRSLDRHARIELHIAARGPAGRCQLRRSPRNK